jgi:hypothetical protein
MWKDVQLPGDGYSKVGWLNPRLTKSQQLVFKHGNISQKSCLDQQKFYVPKHRLLSEGPSSGS